MFTLTENFRLYDENSKPYGIRIQSSSNLWHKHAFASSEGYRVASGGNKYFLDTPKTDTFESRFVFSFGALDMYAGVSVYFGYDPETFSGFELRAEWQKNNKTLAFRIFEIINEQESEIAASIVEQIDFPSSECEYIIEVNRKEDNIFSKIGDCEVNFQNICSEEGYVGFSRPFFSTPVIFKEATVTVNCETKELNEFKVEIPLVNGGTMPLTMEYTFFEVDGKKYLKSTLDGGPQYRSDETYKPYPCNRRGQYQVERWFMDRPYFTCNNKKFLLKNGEVNLADPHLAWKNILTKLIPYSQLPISVTVPVGDEQIEEIGFGYEQLWVEGYSTQKGKAEFRFSPSGEYLGQKVFEDTFTLCSPSDKKAVKRIPETVFDYSTVKTHFENNHYFAEDETIVFRIDENTNKKFITYKAVLQDVYGDFLEDLEVKDLTITHAPLPVGVYRIFLSVYYGGQPFKTVDTVFEVFDELGEKSAPLESGLPMLFSTPNEQQYLDHDPFNPWAKKASCNSEHFYSCTAYTGHVAEHKRIWEITKLFGREWYVWLSNNRAMIDYDLDKHLDIIKNADYVYYPSEYEWAVLRSDFNVPARWKQMPKLRELLDKFLAERPGSAQQIGLVKGEPVTIEVIAKLHQHYQNEWYLYAHKAIKEMFVRQNEELKEYNPKFKRACYGPFSVYIATMRTTKLSEMFGFECGDTLSDVIYTGFAQFEDYPYSCAYQSYRGAFGVGASLVDTPKLKIYPEQYRTSRGGCIDGAVFYANPPIGTYKVPLWFNTTHAREFVYNTPRKTADGYAYWDTYGFMNRDFNEDENDAFVRDWKYVLKYQPKNPLKSIAYVCSFNNSDDGFDGDYPSALRSAYNISEEGIGYLYESSRLAGLPAGFFLDWENLKTLTEDDTDVLVLPSTEGVDEQTLQKIRQLHANGVALIAVSKVDGLEDLFGVKKHPQNVKFTEIHTPEGEHEGVYPMEVTANYVENGAKCILYASQYPAIFIHKNTALFNISPAAMGRTWFFKLLDLARTSNSQLLRNTVNQLLEKLSTPLAKADNCGITLFETQKGEKILLAIDYSDHNEAVMDVAEEKTIWFKTTQFKDAVSVDGKPLRKFISDAGILEGVALPLRNHESALIKLI